MAHQVELRDLRVFVALAEELHFGRTAERLGVTPSRVSQTIQLLERRLGGALFVRTSRRVTLTALGEALRDRLEPVLGQLADALQEIAESATGMAGTLRIGMYAPIVGGDFVALIRAFHAQHPASRVELVETGLARNPLDWLRREEVDALLMRLPLSEPDIHVGPILSSESRVVLVAADHPLARRSEVTYDDLTGYAVPDSETLPREVMDALIPPVTPSGHQLRRVKSHGIGEAMMRVATGEIVHPSVASVLDHFPSAGVVAIPIVDLPPSQTALVWLTAKANNKLERFAELAASVDLTLPARFVAKS